MQINEALNNTIKHFGIKGKDLSASTGLMQATLSKFRNGHCDMHISGLERIMAALTDEQYHYFMSQLVLERKSQEEVKQMLSLIAEKIERGEIRMKVGFQQELLVG